jgi:8-oxo-dGTP diphosphatase
MQRRKKARSPILAAGGVVLRSSREPLIAIVQLRKYDDWVLPKGKINDDESALAAARREVLEEVGHKTYVHAFLGTIAYDVGERIKVVQFWAMRAVGGPARRLMPDVKAVEWLPLACRARASRCFSAASVLSPSRQSSNRRVAARRSRPRCAMPTICAHFARAHTVAASRRVVRRLQAENEPILTQSS